MEEVLSFQEHIDAEANSEKEEKAEIVAQPNGLFCLQKLHSYLENVDLEAIRKLMKLYRIDCSTNPAFGNILGGRSHCVKQNAKHFHESVSFPCKVTKVVPISP